MCESGLRTIGTSTDGNERIFFVPATCQQYQIKPSVISVILFTSTFPIPPPANFEGV